MNAVGGFVDLRVGAHQQADEDSVWPSFTDIMMVIVMIFLMALVIILLRNVELVNQLRSTMAAERAATEIAQATEQQKDRLAARLTSLEESLSQLRLQLLQAREQNDHNTKQLATRTREVSDLRDERDQLAFSERSLTRERSQLGDRVTSLETTQTQLSSEKATLEQRLAAISTNLSELEKTLATKDVTLNTLTENKKKDEQALTLLRGEFGSLKTRYDRLVRPARTSAGRHIVEVYIRKAGDRLEYKIRETDGGEYRSVSRAKMNARLGALKKRYADKLYTKIVIPENSGLSYNEAWSFTRNVLNGYDYYYQ